MCSLHVHTICAFAAHQLFYTRACLLRVKCLLCCVRIMMFCRGWDGFITTVSHLLLPHFHRLHIRPISAPMVSSLYQAFLYTTTPPPPPPSQHNAHTQTHHPGCSDLWRPRQPQCAGVQRSPATRCVCLPPVSHFYGASSAQLAALSRSSCNACHSQGCQQQLLKRKGTHQNIIEAPQAAPVCCDTVC